MADTKYKLRYLPLFYKDLEEKIVYITEKLHNKKVANDLLQRRKYMMYPYMTLADETEIVHSEMFEKLLHRIKKEHSL